MTALSSLRLFVAVEFPSNVKQELVEFVDALKNSVRKNGLKWARRESFHITLKFIGAVPKSDVSQMTSVLTEAMTDLKPFDVSLGGLGTFGSPSHPRVLWLGVSQGSQGLVDLASRVETALHSLGYPKEERPFSPHLTLARVKRGGRLQPERPLAAILKEKPPDFSAFLVSEVSLMQSFMRPEGSSYERLERFPLFQLTGRKP